MSNKINIDELLKQELSNLEVDAPHDVWQNLDNALSNSTPVQQTSTEVLSNASSFKSAALGIKTVIFTASAIALSAVALYQFVLKPDSPDAKKPIESAQQQLVLPNKPDEGLNGSGFTAVNEQTDKSQGVATKQSVNRASKVSELKASKSISAATEETPINNIPQENKPTGKNQPFPIKAEAPFNANGDKSGNNAHPKGHEGNEQISKTSPYQTDDDYTEPNVPNVFTPNGDGLNDEFVITIEQDIIYDLKIINFKGEVLFETTDKNKHWDGKHQFTGVACGTGVYILAFRYQVQGMKEPKVINSKVIIEQ